MASVGAISCTFVRGTVPGWRRRTSTWTVPGVNGVGIKQQGLGPAEFALDLVLRDTIANVNVWLALLEAAVGTVVTIVNDWGETATYCVIRELGPPRKQPDGGVLNGCVCTVPARGYRAFPG